MSGSNNHGKLRIFLDNIDAAMTLLNKALTPGGVVVSQSVVISKDVVCLTPTERLSQTPAPESAVTPAGKTLTASAAIQLGLQSIIDNLYCFPTLTELRVDDGVRMYASRLSSTAQHALNEFDRSPQKNKLSSWSTSGGIVELAGVLPHFPIFTTAKTLVASRTLAVASSASLQSNVSTGLPSDIPAPPPMGGAGGPDLLARVIPETMVTIPALRIPSVETIDSAVQEIYAALAQNSGDLLTPETAGFLLDPSETIRKFTHDTHLSHFSNTFADLIEAGFSQDLPPSTQKIRDLLKSFLLEINPSKTCNALKSEAVAVSVESPRAVEVMEPASLAPVVVVPEREAAPASTVSETRAMPVATAIFQPDPVVLRGNVLRMARASLANACHTYSTFVQHQSRLDSIFKPHNKAFKEAADDLVRVLNQEFSPANRQTVSDLIAKLKLSEAGQDSQRNITISPAAQNYERALAAYDAALAVAVAVPRM